jgi:hypothetical protein
LTDDRQVDLLIARAAGDVGYLVDRRDGDEADAEEDPEALGAEPLGDFTAGDEPDRAVDQGHR